MDCVKRLNKRTERNSNVSQSAAGVAKTMQLEAGVILLVVFATAFLFLMFGTTPAFADPPFELDGNATSNDFPGDEWDAVNSGSGNPLARTGLIVDRPEPPFAQFTGGGSKDQQNVPNWRHRTGTPPAKDDITNAYAAAYENPDNGNLIIVFGIDRFDTSGDAQLGFWFLQDDVKPIAGGLWNGVHLDGDILALVNFSGGGSVPTIQIFRWLNGAPVSMGTGQQVLCTGGFIPGGQNVCGISNSVSVPAPWPYQNKDVGTTTQFPPAAFFEGAIDLTALGVEGCFTQFLAESRSSTSITATLKDFASPAEGFNLCGIDVTKNCSNPRLNNTSDGIVYDISGKVTNVGAGNVFNIALSDAPPADGAFQRVDCTTSTLLGTFPFSGPLAGGEEVCYKNTMTVPLDQNGLEDTITATGNTESDGSGATVTAEVTAQCPNLPLSAAINVSKECASIVVVQNSTVVAKVNVSGQVCNTGDGPLSNVTVTDDKAGVLLGPLTLAEDECQPYSGTYTPEEADDALGNPTNCASAVVFKDTATANAEDIFGNPVTHSDVAECPLCPGSCSP